MNDSATFEYSGAYSARQDPVRWEGRAVSDREQFERYLRDAVRPRLADEESSFSAEMRGLATTGMETRHVERLLRAVPEPRAWEVGEAFAECALRDDPARGVHWPWNTVRDRRTPRASLPGADLVGFCRDGADVLLLVGEVKTSSDVRTPPAVMRGGSGMEWQLRQIPARLDLQRALLQWLHARCQSRLHRTLFEEAAQRYVASEGTALALVGVLVRDTAPNELDWKTVGGALAGCFDDPTRVDLIAWYLPVPLADWPALVREDTP